jgi:hypothetical protein
MMFEKEVLRSLSPCFLKCTGEMGSRPNVDQLTAAVSFSSAAQGAMREEAEEDMDAVVDAVDNAKLLVRPSSGIICHLVIGAAGGQPRARPRARGEPREQQQQQRRRHPRAAAAAATTTTTTCRPTRVQDARRYVRRLCIFIVILL